MTYRVVLDPKALAKLGGFPHRGMDSLTSLLAAVIEDPYDAVHSVPAGRDARQRIAWLGDVGFVELTIDDDAWTVTVTDLLWAG